MSKNILRLTAASLEMAIWFASLTLVTFGEESSFSSDFVSGTSAATFQVQKQKPLTADSVRERQGFVIRSFERVMLSGLTESAFATESVYKTGREATGEVTRGICDTLVA